MNNSSNNASGRRGQTIGVDIGGTFTDTIVVDESGTVAIGKEQSTPPDFEQGFMSSLGSAAQRMGLSFGDLVGNADAIYHACTVGTNALVENRTAKVGLLTTRGTRDSIFIMQSGGRLWGMSPTEIAHVAAHRKPDPIVPKHLIAEIDERVAFDGEVIVEMDEEQCREAVRGLLAQGVETFAICLLWSVVNPDHEIALAEIVRDEAPHAFVTNSAEVSPRTGEYERTVATVINAAIGPAMATYLEALEGELSKAGYANPLHIMTCAGGVIEPGYARRLPILTMGSGPVAGVIGAGALARSAAASRGDSSALNVISGDMGGTTFDVGVIRAGQPLRRPTTRLGQYAYFVPTLDVRSIGAGGGSIVRYDEDRRSLAVGPQSAGARPGPVAYGRGGTEPTVTDAGLVLGYLNPDYFLGGEISLDIDAARDALARAGAPLGLGAEATAAAAARICDSQMADAIRVASVQQGYDPREHVLYAFGGGGPVHATGLALELGIRRIVMPLSDIAAGWSALGAASSEAVVIREMPALMDQPFDIDKVNRSWERLESEALAVMAGQGVPATDVRVQRFTDMRYSTQVHEVEVDAPDGVYDEAAIADLVDAFEREYERLFGEGSSYAGAEHVMTSMRVRARASLGGFKLAESDGSGGTPTQKGERDVIFYERGIDPVRTPVYDGQALSPGMEIAGPAIVEFMDTTLVLRAETQRATVDPLGSVVVDL
jgi:N-methylhydantoinase A